MGFSRGLTAERVGPCSRISLGTKPIKRAWAVQCEFYHVSVWELYISKLILLAPWGIRLGKDAVMGRHAGKPGEEVTLLTRWKWSRLLYVTHRSVWFARCIWHAFGQLSKNTQLFFSSFFLRSPIREDVKLLCESERGVVLSSVFRSTEEGAAEVYTVYLKLIF